MNNNFDNVEEMKELIVDELSECEFDNNFSVKNVLNWSNVITKLLQNHLTSLQRA